MPIHSEHTASVPYKFGKMPKNFMEQSNKVEEKFLDNYLCEVEELKDNTKLSFILNQYRKYHCSADIRISDNFLKRNIEYHSAHSLFGVIASSKLQSTSGPTLETVGSTNSTDAYGSFLVCNILTGTTVNDLYNRIAVDVGDSNGSFHIGAYDDVLGAPTNLLVTAGAFTPDSAYTDRTVTEFSIATTTTWLAFNDNGATTASTWKTLSGQTSGNNRYKARALSALPDPAGTGFTSHTKVVRMRISHS